MQDGALKKAKVGSGAIALSWNLGIRDYPSQSQLGNNSLERSMKQIIQPIVIICNRKQGYSDRKMRNDGFKLDLL
jgi:hypothetical protein